MYMFTEDLTGANIRSVHLESDEDWTYLTHIQIDIQGREGFGDHGILLKLAPSAVQRLLPLLQKCYDTLEVEDLLI